MPIKQQVGVFVQRWRGDCLAGIVQPWSRFGCCALERMCPVINGDAFATAYVDVERAQILAVLFYMTAQHFRIDGVLQIDQMTLNEHFTVRKTVA